LALDEDATEKGNKMADLLRKYGILAHKIDAGGYKDVGEMTKSVFLERKSKATSYDDFDSLINRMLYVI